MTCTKTQDTINNSKWNFKHMFFIFPLMWGSKLLRATDLHPPKIHLPPPHTRGDDITPFSGNHGYTYGLLAKISIHTAFPWFFFLPLPACLACFAHVSLYLLELTLFPLSHLFLHLFPYLLPCIFSFSWSVHFLLSFMSSPSIFYQCFWQ